MGAGGAKGALGVRTRVGGWRGRSRIAQVDSYTRWTLYLLPGLFPLVPTLALLSGSPGRGGSGDVVLLLLGWAQCGVGMVLFRRALDHYRLRHPAPWRWIALSGVLLVASVVQLVFMVRAEGPTDASSRPMVPLGGPLVFFGSLSLVAPRVRTYLWWSLLGSVATAVAVLPFGGRPVGALITMVLVWVVALWALATIRSAGWMLAVMWEAEHARTVQARLAVAEERLRFGRDMHDVLGRNLTVIALKSELAAELARRGSPAALEQMTEVQRVARDAQRDMRELVRGYRQADLHTELVGARGVLGAAGIACRIDDGPGDALPDAVQSVLAWVVREGTTNVLRHAEARRCAIRLRVAGASAVLEMENDGVSGGSETAGGSGLAGLRERVTALGGTLEAGRRAKATFLLTVEVPLAAAEEVPVAAEEVPVAAEEVPVAAEEVPVAAEEVPVAEGPVVEGPVPDDARPAPAPGPAPALTPNPGDPA
ncbi:sensor histidine kinase [Streptomyces huiliensis]|uniref:sensor histidine kinase n=1 Tax=Streptomyces huiliensis TaxID=2876027 RepID=UPI0021E0C895|nr:sensor histidine kinase [Streptomyces huiliensis]MBZ4318020.1 sensor histidine kinase [Streptomyces huiliensis]